MADGRMIRKKASTDDRLAQLSSNACLLYVLSIPHLDIDGRMDGLPVAVRGTVVPYRARRHAAEWTDELVERYIVEWTVTVDEDSHPRPLVLWYCVKGVWVCAFTGFAGNQTLRRDREAPSRFPAPPEDLLSAVPSRAIATLQDAAPGRPDADLGPIGERLFADADHPPRAAAAAPGDAAPHAPMFPTPELLRPEAEAEVEVESSAEQRGAFARARHRDPGGAALPDAQISGKSLSEEILSGVARRSAALVTHGPLARLLEVLHDADENTPKVMHALFDPLGEAAIEHARNELLAYQPRRPSAYAQGIARKWAKRHGVTV